jgi:hypothetical protein
MVWPEWMSRATAAQYCDVDWSQVESWRSNDWLDVRQLPAFRGNKPQIRISKKSLDRLLAEGPPGVREKEPQPLTLEKR